MLYNYHKYNMGILITLISEGLLFQRNETKHNFSATFTQYHKRDFLFQSVFTVSS